MSRIEDSLNELLGAGADLTTCPRCGNALEEREVKEAIPVGKDEVVYARIPVHACNSCEFVISAEGAEKVRDAAVRLYQGLLTSEQIKEIRDNLGFSRREFSEAFGLPQASMERWENGRLIQSRSHDTLLRALANKATAAALDRRRMGRGFVSGIDSVVAFTSLKSNPATYSDALARAQKFSLRKMLCSVARSIHIKVVSVER